MSKQDRQGARTPADLERKYSFGKTFAEVFGIATDAQKQAAAAMSAYSNLNQEEIFKRLTNNGSWQGMYRDGDNIYINASYIKSGEFLADLIKAGILQSTDGETFKLDLDKGIFSLKSGGYDVMNINKDGATLSGWKLNKDYLGTDEAGLNGSIAHYGTSEKDNSPSQLRFFAGMNDATESKYAEFIGIVNSQGYFQAYFQIDYMAADNPDAEILSIMCGNLSLTADDFATDQQLTVSKISANTLMAWGRLTNEDTYGKALSVQISYQSCVPSWQVLDDGTLIVKYAKIGGYSIADLVARIEALEKG